RRPRSGTRPPGTTDLRQGRQVVRVPLPPAVVRAIDHAIGDRASGSIVLNRRGAGMDRHANLLRPGPQEPRPPLQLHPRRLQSLFRHLNKPHLPPSARVGLPRGENPLRLAAIRCLVDRPPITGGNMTPMALPTPTLHTARLRLRPFDDTDAND